MPDARAGSWAAINGQEVTNAQRTVSYIQNFGLPVTVDADCWCPSIQDLLGCPGPASGYTFPSKDPAPWYDPAIPDSGDFLGFLTTEFDGLGSTYTRTTFETLQGGAVLGRLRPQARTLTWKGYLFGRTCCAAEYGLRWITARLADASGCDGCDGGDLDILLCCPEPTGTVITQPARCATTNHVTSCSTKVDVGVPPPLAVETKNSDAFRTFHKVGLIDGPKKVSERTFGCGGDCDEGGCIIEAEFSMVAANPFMHKDPTKVCAKPFPACDDACDPNNPTWIDIVTTAYPASAADGVKCMDSLDCSVLDTGANCILDPNCPTASLPVIAPFEDPCGCEGFFTTRVCCEISNDIYGKFFEGVPTIDIYSGATTPLRNVVLSFYENPQSRTCSDTQIFQSDCFQCSKVNIRYIPANTTITVDGLTKRITAKCPGQDPVPAESLTVSPFKWPVLKCIDYIVSVEADCSFPVGSDTLVTVTVTPREM